MVGNLHLYGDQNVQVPIHLNFGKYMLERLRRMGDEVAIENAETGENITYKEITDHAVKLSVALTQLGVSKGDVVALGSEKRLMFIPTSLAIILSGAIYTSYDFSSGRSHLKHKIDITQPKYFICTELFWETNHEILQCSKTIKAFITLDNASEKLISVKSLLSSNNDVDISVFEPLEIRGQVDTAVIMYSSGTTGMPKGVKMTHLNCILYTLPLEPIFTEETIKSVYITGDWFHNCDLFFTYKTLALGKKLVYTTDISPNTMIMAFEKAQVNIACLVPSLVNLLSKTEGKNKNCNLRCLKYVISGASPLHMNSNKALIERFPSIKHVLQKYGMTETWSLTFEAFSTKGPRMGTVGSVAPCVTLKVANPETHEALGPHKPGEICMKGPVLMQGYIGIDPSTYIDRDGWFRTGDLGYYDEDGYFYVIDRLKDVIDYDGYKVTPMELESILHSHPGVREASVVGKPVPVYGEAPTAFVVRQPGSDVTEQQLIDFVAVEVAPYMQLRGGVRFIPQVPRNARGKVLRQRLREMLKEE